MRARLEGILAAVAFLAPCCAYAEAPGPKVTIDGLFDQVTAAGSNFYDGNYTRTGDREWYARLRFRPDFRFEVGRTKAELELQIDITYGQSGACAAGPGKAAVPAAGGPLCPGEKTAGTSSSSSGM